MDRRTFLIGAAAVAGVAASGASVALEEIAPFVDKFTPVESGLFRILSMSVNALGTVDTRMQLISNPQIHAEMQLAKDFGLRPGDEIRVEVMSPEMSGQTHSFDTGIMMPMADDVYDF